MVRFGKVLLGIVLSVCLVSPIRVQTFTYSPDQSTFVRSTPSIRVPLSVLAGADLNGDGRVETVGLLENSAVIRQNEKIVWSSPAAWQVIQAEMTDLNHDGKDEAALLVYRPYKPWPVDRYLAGVSRTGLFHDAQNRSCQIILIGWKRDRYDEIWAGSALAEPLQHFAVMETNTNHRQALIAFETTYDQHPSGSVDAVSIWNWNGFGFTLESRTKMDMRNYALGLNSRNQLVIQFSSDNS
jgi:hypothetical protein